jgi:hypothetical protein
VSLVHIGDASDKPKKTAESTGRLPPTPTLQTAAREHNVIESGDAPAETANTPVIKRVRLKDNLDWRNKRTLPINFKRKEKEAHLRPHTSDPTPQKTAPTSKPMFCPSLRKGPLKANSLTTGVRMSPVTIFKDRYSDQMERKKDATYGPEIISVQAQVSLKRFT